MTTTIFNIQRFSIYDGPGIRTSVFLKGCNLRCAWCHNPESFSAKPTLGFYPEKCIGCGRCISSCPEGAHSVTPEGEHRLDRSKCVACGKCAYNCFAEALTMLGKSMTSEEVIKAILTDKEYYAQSGGGVTFTGGECMLQPDFLCEIMNDPRMQGISFAVDTAGAVPWSSFEKVLPTTDIFLYDIKAADSALHKELTGQPNELIWENLTRLSKLKKRLILRYPFIPPYNTGEAEALASLVASLPYFPESVEIMPYHRLGEGKYLSAGLENRASRAYVPSEEDLERAVECFTSRGISARRS